MKPTSLLISILVFFISGVMCLFSTADVSAQVPQTKRSEIDGWLKGIRSKKKNNDLQKRSQNKRNGTKIRLRGLMMDTIKFDDGIAWTQSIYFVWGKIGFGKSIFGYKKDLNSYDYFRIKNLTINEISLTFGNSHTFTIGGGLVSNGESKIHLYKTDEYLTSQKNKGYSYFGIYGLSSNYFEYLLGYRFQKVESFDFSSDKNFSKINNSYEVDGNQLMLGIGITF